MLYGHLFLLGRCKRLDDRVARYRDTDGAAGGLLFSACHG